MSPAQLGWIAFGLVGGGAALWFRLAYAVRLPGHRGGFVAAWAGGAALGLAALVLGPGWLAGVPATLALLGGALLTGMVAISGQRTGAHALRVGDPIPAFEAPDEHGATFSSASLAGRPVLLKFFRGHW